MRGQNHVHRRESDKDRQMDRVKQIYPLQTSFAGGGYNYIHVDILDVDIIIIMWT